MNRHTENQKPWNHSHDNYGIEWEARFRAPRSLRNSLEGLVGSDQTPYVQSLADAHRYVAYRGLQAIHSELHFDDPLETSVTLCLEIFRLERQKEARAVAEKYLTSISDALSELSVFGTPAQLWHEVNAAEQNLHELNGFPHLQEQAISVIARYKPHADPPTTDLPSIES